jgi:hypothetical protein
MKIRQKAHHDLLRRLLRVADDWLPVGRGLLARGLVDACAWLERKATATTALKIRNKRIDLVAYKARLCLVVLLLVVILRTITWIAVSALRLMVITTLRVALIRLERETSSTSSLMIRI